MPASLVAGLAPVVGAGIGKLIGGGGPENAQAVVPQDLQGMRGQQRDLLNYLLGMGPDPRNQQPVDPYTQLKQQGLAGLEGVGGNAAERIRNRLAAAPIPGQTQATGGSPILRDGLSAPAVGGLSMDPMGSTGGNANGGGVMTPQQRLESFFGQLGVNPSGLQNQGSNALSQFLNQPSPERRAAETSLPQLTNTINGGSPETQASINRLSGLQTGAGADVEGRLSQLGTGPSTGSDQLQQMLTNLGMGKYTDQLQGLGQVNVGPGVQANTGNEAVGLLNSIAAGRNPGEGVVSALQPLFERNLAQANQVGGRFGSGNAILRSRGVEDFNNTAAQALQRGVDQQAAAANAMGQLILGGNQLGANTALGSRGQDVQAAIASAGNALQGGLTGVGSQLQALGLAQQGQQGLNDTVLNALRSLGGFRETAQGQESQNLQAAGNLGLGQGQLQNSAAQILSQIMGQQGGAERANAMNAFNAGNVETGQQNVGQQQTLDILRQLLGTAQSATLNTPVSVQPSGAQQGAQLGGQLAQILALFNRPQAATG